MKYLRLALIYVGSGVISGMISGASTELKPLGLILPGPVFGITFICASMLIERPLRLPWVFICLAAFAFVAAEFAFLLSLGFVDDVPGGRAIVGGLCGLVGAIVLAMHSGVEEGFNELFFVVISIVGCLLGAMMLPFEILLNDSGYLPGPFKFMPLFITWQSGVMLTLGIFRYKDAEVGQKSSAIQKLSEPR